MFHMAFIIAKAWGACKDREEEKIATVRKMRYAEERAFSTEDAVDEKKCGGAWFGNAVLNRDATARPRSKNILQ